MLYKIQQLHVKDLLGFDPKDIIVIANKWDFVMMLCDEDEDEDEDVFIWNSLKSDLRNRWPNVKE